MALKRGPNGRFYAKHRICVCGNPTMPRRGICEACKNDSVRRSRAEQMRRVDRMKAKIEAGAERETRRLKRQDSFTPLDGEAIVLKWIRGEG